MSGLTIQIKISSPKRESFNTKYSHESVLPMDSINQMIIIAFLRKIRHTPKGTMAIISSGNSSIAYVCFLSSFLYILNYK